MENKLKNNNNSVWGFIALIVAMFVLNGCAGLPDGQVHKVESMTYTIKQQAEFLDARKQYFDTLNKHAEWEFIKPYLESEKWSDYLVLAHKEYNAAKNTYTNELLPMLDRDDPEETSAFTLLIIQFNSQIESSTNHAMRIEKRIEFLLKTRDNVPAIYTHANDEYSQIKTIQKMLIQKAEQAYTDYPNKKDDIKKRIEILNELVNQASESRSHITQQFAKKRDANYAVFGDESIKISQLLIKSIDYQKQTNTKLDQLYRSYTKVLADQRIEYFIVVGRANWCESDYCGGGSSRSYPPSQVDDKVYEYFDTLRIDTIATMRSSWGSLNFELAIPQAQWNALGIEKQWRWPRGDNYADYWIEKSYTHTYHKYIEIVNDKMTEGEWVKVDEVSFWNDYDNLGMAILTKPYGFYESDSITDAQPAGIANIATPIMSNGVPTGSNQYGEWRHSNGSSFWYYYGMYRMFGGLGHSRRYSYGDWSSYNNRARGKPYYGRNQGYGTYGAYTYNNSRYQNSDYAKRNPGEVRSSKSDRSSKTNSSIRGAGASTRSRGAAGGGK